MDGVVRVADGPLSSILHALVREFPTYQVRRSVHSTLKLCAGCTSVKDAQWDQRQRRASHCGVGSLQCADMMILGLHAVLLR